jgi:sulfite exporter TauE/SafE
MLKNTFVIAVLLIVSIITYYLYENLKASPAEASSSALIWLSFGVSTISFILAVVGLSQKIKDGKKY